jgi:hypothetical protein
MNEYNVHGQSMYRVHAQYCHRSGGLKIDHTYVVLLVNNEDIFLDVSGWSDISTWSAPPAGLATKPVRREGLRTRDLVPEEPNGK